MGWTTPRTTEFRHRTRRAVLIGLALAVVPTSASRASEVRVPRVLFICRFGTVKSPIAREHLRRRAAERGVAVTVQSRGLTPDDHLEAPLAVALANDGIDVRSEPVRAFGPADLEGVDVVVMFDPPPATGPLASALDWSDLPSMNRDYAHARADLLRRIDQLLDELAATP